MKNRNFVMLSILLIAAISGFSACNPDAPIEGEKLYSLTLIQPSAGGSFTATVGSKSAVYDTAKAAEGDTITLTAMPGASYIFLGFKVTPAQTLDGTGNIQTFVMPAEKVEITAEFISKSSIKYPITVTQPSIGGTFTVTVGSAAAVSADTESVMGELITLTAVPDSTHIFGSFAVTPNQTLSGIGNTRNFIMPEEAIEVTIVFIDKYTILQPITVTQPASGGTFTVTVGSEAAVSTDTQSVMGEVITLTAVPESTHFFDSFTVTPTQTLSGSGNTWTFVMPEEAVTITGVFIDKTSINYPITITQPGIGGSFTVAVGSAAPNYFNTQAFMGQTITLTAIPSSGTYTLDSFTVTPAQTLSGSGNTWTFVMPEEAVAISAVFIDRSAILYPITVTQPASGGTFTVAVGSAGAVSISTESVMGQTITLTASPNSTHIFDSFTVTPSQTLSGSGNIRTFVMPEEAVAISAVFIDRSTILYPITVTQPASGGTFTVAVGSAGAVSVSTESVMGQTITLTASPNITHNFQGFTITPTQTLSGSGNVQTFVMPEEAISITAVFNVIPVLTYPLAIESVETGVAIGNYDALIGNTGPGWSIQTSPRRAVYCDFEAVGAAIAFGRSGRNVAITGYQTNPDTCVVIDINITPTPFTYILTLTVNGTDYSGTVSSVLGSTDVLLAIPLSQMLSSSNVAMTSLTGTLTVTGWSLYASTTGKPGTYLYGISLREIKSRTITKGTMTGPVGNDFILPAFNLVPVGNVVPVTLSMVANNRFLGFSFTPDPGIVSGTVGTTYGYLFMPDADITISATFERIPDPDMFYIEDLVDASKRGNTGWYKDWCNTTYGYWQCNVPTQYTSATVSGPSWIAANLGDAINGSQYVAVNPVNKWILNMEASTGMIYGRNLPVAMDISSKDTIRLLFRRSAAATLSLGLFNGGTPLASFGDENGTGESINTALAGTPYWVSIPTSSGNGVWDFLEIPLASFTTLGFNPAALSGYGIRVDGTISGTIHNRAKHYIDNIVAINQADKKNISVTAVGGTASTTYTTAIGGQVIPITTAPTGTNILDSVTANGIPCTIADTNRPFAIILPDGLIDPVVISVNYRTPVLTAFEDFETSGTFVNLSNQWTGSSHNNRTGWFTVTNNTVATATGTFDTTQTRPGTAGTQSVLLTYSNTGTTARQFRIGYRPYNPVINATEYTHINFWARSSRTGTFSAVLRNSNNTDISVTWTINTANTWEEKLIALPSSARTQINYLGFSLTGPAAVTTNATLYIDDVSWAK